MTYESAPKPVTVEKPLSLASFSGGQPEATLFDEQHSAEKIDSSLVFSGDPENANLSLPAHSMVLLVFPAR